MNEIRDYPSRLSDPASRRFETFSYLPPLSDEQIRQQVSYIVAKGWQPVIEHSEPDHATRTYWYLWKLPLFGETDVERILAEIVACHTTHPGHHIRLTGYDNYSQSPGTALVIYRGKIVAT
jgi:ribulose-bisphosphate carboxylase small chain